MENGDYYYFYSVALSEGCTPIQAQEMACANMRAEKHVKPFYGAVAVGGDVKISKLAGY